MHSREENLVGSYIEKREVRSYKDQRTSIEKDIRIEKNS